MNTIDLNAANQSAVACWRELLRALDALHPRAWSGGLQQETSEIRFVLQGSQHKKAFEEILAFFLSDLPVDVSTRREIFMNNIQDMEALKIFKGVPKELFQDIPSEEQKKRLMTLYAQRKELKEDVIFLDPSKSAERPFHVKLSARIALLNNEIAKYEQHKLLNIDAYLQWLVSALGSTSAQDCQFVYEAQEELLQRQLSVDVVCEPPLLQSVNASERSNLKR